jgi:hypothetical protein
MPLRATGGHMTPPVLRPYQCRAIEQLREPIENTSETLPVAVQGEGFMKIWIVKVTYQVGPVAHYFHLRKVFKSEIEAQEFVMKEQAQPGFYESRITKVEEQGE